MIDATREVVAGGGTRGRRFYVYVIDDGSRAIYVGKGTGSRCMAHLQREGMAHVDRLHISVFYVHSESEALSTEASIIHSLIEKGEPLLNRTIPRLGTSGGKVGFYRPTESLRLGQQRDWIAAIRDRLRDAGQDWKWASVVKEQSSRICASLSHGEAACVRADAAEAVQNERQNRRDRWATAENARAYWSCQLCIALRNPRGKAGIYRHVARLKRDGELHVMRHAVLLWAKPDDYRSSREEWVQRLVRHLSFHLHSLYPGQPMRALGINL